MSFTKGPWRVCHKSMSEGGRGFVVADVNTAFGSIAIRGQSLPPPMPSKAILDRIGEANARLIAAAPDLLLACNAVHHQLSVGEAGEGDKRDLKWCERTLAAALKKARAPRRN